MEVRSDPSFNVASQKSMSSSPFTEVQDTPLLLGQVPDSEIFKEKRKDGVKPKRGRPRKYGPSDGTMESKKKKNKPFGSGTKHQMKALGTSGIGFTPHVITVKTGEDVSAKIISFFNHGPRAVCVLSANGAISNVTLQQASSSGGTVSYEGRFEILSLSGSFLVSESSDQRSRTGGLSVSLAGPDGHVLGGGLAGLLIAATPVQVIVGSFIIQGGGVRNEPQQMIPLVGESAPGMPRPVSPISRGGLSPSSGGGHDGGPHNQSFNGRDYIGNNNQSLPVMSWM